MIARLHLAALLILTSCVFGAVPARGQQRSSELKHPVSVVDAVAMTTIADQPSPLESLGKVRVAHFSPDGTRFVIVIKKGNPEKNTNEFSLLLFETARVFRSREPDYVLTMSSASNRDAISTVEWLENSDTLTFLGENPGEAAQIYALNVRTKRLTRLTNRPTAITAYAADADAHVIIYTANPLKQARSAEEAHGRPIVIMGQSLPDILAGNCAEPAWDSAQLFLQRRGHAPVKILTQDGIWGTGYPLRLSPDGKYALIKAYIREVPKEWASYSNRNLHAAVTARRMAGQLFPSLQRYLLLDTQTRSLMPLLNTPLWGSGERIAWALDGRSVFLEKMYLPLEPANPEEREERKANRYDVEITLPTREFRKVPSEDWPKQRKVAPRLEVALEEDINTPPKVYATDSETGQTGLVLDLNPELARLTFGDARTIEWNVHGVEVTGGLYLPVEYVAGRRYPLVIQTHGFVPNQFSMDGRSEWSSGFAARPLAAQGFIVLQALKLNDKDRDLIGADRTLGATTEQAFKNFHVLAYEAAIDYLDHEGMIDRNRVGISGFSRTVCFVAQTLTHTNYKFGAAVLTDGIDCGYFQELAFPGSSWDFQRLNGGVPPFGDGLGTWVKESPGFNLDKVHTPLRLVALGRSSVLETWEWFVGLYLQRKPVDFVLMPDGVHLLTKPSERIAAQQGLVDWFRFWLKGEENRDPEKREQNGRWRELRREQEAESLAAGENR